MDAEVITVSEKRVTVTMTVTEAKQLRLSLLGTWASPAQSALRFALGYALDDAADAEAE